MAHLGESSGSTFSDFVDRLSVSRDALSRTLGFLDRLNWVGKAKASSAYLLSRTGARLAPPCLEIVQLAEAQQMGNVILSRWTLPVVASLHGWSLRFNELKAMLPDITPRALALALKTMHAAGLIEREILGGFPPTSSYRLTKRGERFFPPLDRLSKT